MARLKMGEVVSGTAAIGVVLLLAGCAQTGPGVVQSASSSSEAAERHAVIARIMAELPPTHGSVQDLTYNSRYRPVFPPKAARAGHYGDVVLMVDVDAHGDITHIEVERSSGYPELDASAVDAAKHWVFVPAAKDGVPQPVHARAPVSFSGP